MLRRTFRSDGYLFNLFYLAEKLGKTADELLLGKIVPLSDTELTCWLAYWTVKKEMEEDAEDRASSREAEEEEIFPRMMGQ